MSHMAAWTPDAPDGLYTSPSAAIAAGEQAFDPEALDHFDGIATCGAVFVAVVAPSANHPDTWQRIELQCIEDDGHYPGTAHQALHTWGDSNTLPAEPDCPKCADVGVNPQGEPCDCGAGQPFAEAVKVVRGLATDGT